MAQPPDDRSRSFTPRPRVRRRFTVWTLLAPAAVLVLWVGFFTSLGNSCVFDGSCGDSKGSKDASAAETDPRNDLKKGTKVKVKAGDNLGAIAEKYELTQEELQACNPTVDPQALRPGQRLVVSAVDCEDADLRETGANPDPFADDAAASAAEGIEDSADNGTAAADPSATKQADEGSDG